MKRILVNGISAKSGGGKSILRNFLAVLSRRELDFEYVVIVSDISDYQEFHNRNIKIIEYPNSGTAYFLLYFSMFILPRLLERYNIALLFNLAGVPSKTKTPQLFLFQWAYAAYPDSEAWKRSALRDLAIRKTKLFLFRRNLKFVDVMLVQTAEMQRALDENYNIDKFAIVPNAVSIDSLGQGADKDFGLSKSTKLLCLSRYYTHKNIEIFLPVARLIKARSLDVQIIVTIAPGQHAKGDAFLSETRRQGLDDIIINVGAVPMEFVPSLYRQVDGLLFPTLLESFSGTYVEAMFYRKPILTSKMGFARAVCGEAALYFDPLSPDGIVDQIEYLLQHPAAIQKQADEAARILNTFPDWPQVVESLTNIFGDQLA